MASGSWGSHSPPLSTPSRTSATYGFYTPEKEKIREAVNAWIRADKTADGLIDFDKLLEDPNNPKHINPAFDCGDHLHPNDVGYQAMSKAVDLSVLVPKE